MYKLCKTEQSAQRQRQLEDGLMEAMLLQRFEDISVSDLCDQLGVPRKSFYRYFDSKDGALYALIDHRFLEYETMRFSQEQKRGAGVSDLFGFFEYWLAQQSLLDALDKSGLSSLLAERALAIAQEIQTFDIPSTRMPREFSKLSNAFVVSGLITLVLQWHQNGFRETPQEMAEMTRVLLTRPLMSNSK